MEQKNQDIFKTLNPNKVYIPVLLGVAVAVWMVADIGDLTKAIGYVRNADPFWFAVGVLILGIRDGGYIYRIRHLTSGALTWKGSFFVIILWEFTSAVTPSVVGGTPVAIFLLHQERIPLGKAVAYVMLTAMFDNLFFLIAAPLALFLVYGFTDLHVFPKLAWGLDESGVIGQYGLPGLFAVSYILIVFYTFIFMYGLFFSPVGFKRLLIRITSFKWLRRFRRGALSTGRDVVTASKELKGKTKSYWFKAAGSTFIIWTARYLMLNCLVQAFYGVNMLDHLLVFARQIAMWIVMLVAPTPGSAGVAEGVFPAFYGELLGPEGHEMSIIVGLSWRLLYYYAYLLLGIIFLPRWLSRIYKLRQKTAVEKS